MQDCPTLMKIILEALASDNMWKIVYTAQNQSAVDKMLSGSMADASELVFNKS